MRKGNTLTCAEFVLGHIVLAVPVLFAYKSLLLRSLEGYTLRQSQVCLVLLLAGYSLIGALIQMEDRRNESRIVYDLIAAVGIYTAIAYYSVWPALVWIVLGISAATSLLGAGIIIGRGNRGKSKKTYKILFRWIWQVARLLYAIFSLGFIMILAVFVVPVLIGNMLMWSATVPADSKVVENYTLEKSMDTVLQLWDEESWAALPMQKQLDVLQTVANIETRYLGLPHELNVGTASTEEDVRGYYVDATHEIVISIDAMQDEPPQELLETVCHEAYHGYEHSLVAAAEGLDEETMNLRWFRKIDSYAKEFQNYKDGTDDWFGYYGQVCEEDARSYAEEAVQDYYSRMAEYLEQQEGG